ncbi:hypothetical protein AGDE_02112 [Angomonas deanei]|nr:hypothetical protein AGDE_12266 [Angomonas deanei]EPY41811.1 hypothetical protein AGDE_02112 [Angomonas deanei]|eukprot:EPY24599.1 hypothetical protein AGDE_12266 [Angomonas deanei]
MALVEEANTTDALEFVSIDASSRPQVFQFFHDHPDTTSIVSCIGVLSRDYHHARAANADTNTNIAAGMCHPKLLPAANKFVYVSSEPYHKHLPFVFNRKITLKGYFHGKQGAEEGITKNLKHRGFILRPGFIYGTRYQSVPSLTTTGGGAALAMPLWMIGKPLDLLLSSVGGRKLLAPPCDVEVLAEAAVRACDWAFLGPEYELTGIADYYRMKEICQRTDPALTQKTQHKEEEEMNSETKEEKA